jgi:tRNA G26 N,N-dimethylase Trm1
MAKQSTTKRGYENRNGQVVQRRQRKSENHRYANAYLLKCKHCEAEYSANGCDIYQRKCPNCQGGEE